MPIETLERRSDALAAPASPELESPIPEPRSGLDRWVAPGLGLGFLLLYLRTLCPTVYMGDSGEICTAIATGGVIHPPGYPLFSLLGRAALVLVPFGEPAFRIGCLVVMAAAATVVALYFLTREIGGSPCSAALAAAAFGVSHTFWSQSTRVEVYSLHALLFCLALWAALRYRRTGSLRCLAGAALAVSLGLAHHLTIVLIGPAGLILCGRRLWTGPGRAGRLGSVIALLLVGPAFYLLLLVWARAEPVHAWGNTVDLSLLWSHASARFYRGLLKLPDGPRLLSGFTRAWTLLSHNFPMLAFLLPGAGICVLWSRNRGTAFGLLAACLAVVGYNLCYRIDDIAPYYLPAWIVAAALTGVVLEAGLRAIDRPQTRAVLAFGASAFLVGIPLLRNWDACDLSRATFARDFARHKLENADPNSVLISAFDNDTFPLWYVHEVLEVRPDVFHIDRVATNGSWLHYHKEPSHWYLHRLRRQGLDIPLDVPRDPAARASLAQDGYLIQRLERELRGRPICMTFFATRTPKVTDRRVFFRWAAARYHQLPLGLLIRLQPKSQPVNLPRLVRENQQRWNAMILPDFRGVRTDDELDPRYITDHYACSLVNFGNLYEMAGDTARAAAIYRLASQWAPRYRPAVTALETLRRSARSRGKSAAVTG